MWKERLGAGQGTWRRWGLRGGGPGTPQTSAPPAALTEHPHPPGTAPLHGQDHEVPPVVPTQSHQTSSTEAGSPHCLEAASGKYAPTHHLGAEAAVVELPHEGQLPGLRPREQVLPDPVHGFQVVFQQPMQTSGACVLWPGGRTALRSTNRADPEVLSPFWDLGGPALPAPWGQPLGLLGRPTRVRSVPPTQPQGATGDQPLPA